VSVERPLAGPTERRSLPGDLVSRRSVEQLRREHPCHEAALARLHDLLPVRLESMIALKATRRRDETSRLTAR
jgi:hypothetical protein